MSNNMSAIDPAQSGDSMEALKKIYCPPLDEALFFALASDYNLDDKSQLAELKAALDSLKDGAIEEQELELLPVIDTDGGKPEERMPGAFPYQDPEHDHSTHPSGSNPRSITEEDGATSVTTGLSGLGLSEGGSDTHGGHDFGYGETGIAMEDLPDEKKVEWLMVMFPSVTEARVKEVLAQYGGQFDQSTDELLNLSFLNHDEHPDQVLPAPIPIVKGIEGFASSDTENQVRRRGKSKGRRRKDGVDSDDAAWFLDSARTSGTATPDPNVWASVPQDVEFIAARTSLKPKLITSVYHANAARLAPTIRALVTKEGEPFARNPGGVDDLLQWQVAEMKHEFEQVPNSQLYGALILAKKMPSVAKELLDVMITSKEEPVLLGKVSGLASYAPLDLSDGENVVKKKVASGWSPLSPSSDGQFTVSHMGNAHGLAASQAFQQASGAYKRGKSDRLMGGAAAYYASVGHDHIKAAKASQAYEADALVSRQSTSTSLDLHGVNVSHAVRIAKEGTERWWEGLGDRKYVAVGGVGQGFRIVTGVGRHSADGIGRIGPAVSKMLVREGWKVEIGRGEVIVWGRARRK